MEILARDRRPRISFPTRLSVRSLLALVAMFGAGLGIRDAYSPFRAWRHAIHDQDEETRYNAMREALSGWSASLDRERAFVEILTALRDPAPAIRSTAASALAWAGPGGERALQELIAATRDISPDVRMEAYNALAWNSTPNTPGRDEAIASLTRGLTDPDGTVRRFAGRGMILCGRGDEALAVCLEAVRDDDSELRRRGIGLLEYLDELRNWHARSALSETYCWKRHDPGATSDPAGGSILEYARVEAASLLARSGGRKESLPILIEASKHRDPKLRRLALIGLEKSAPPTPTPR